jgi:uncharacterized protein with von Willebrand factor type A (vWA) domain
VTDFWEDETPVPVEGVENVSRTKIRSVKRDLFDKAAWDQLLGNTPAVRQNVADLELLFPTSPPAYEDLFHLLFRHTPAFEAESEMVDQYRPQYSLMRSTEGSDDFQFLRKFSTYDDYYTTKALLDLHEPLRKAFEEMEKAFPPAQPEPSQDKSNQSGDSQVQPDTNPDQASEEASADPMPVQSDDAPVEAPREAVAALVFAVHKAADEAEEEQAVLEAYGVETGELKHMSFEERLALSKQLRQDKMGALAKLLGAWRPFGEAERRKKIVHAPGEMVGYDYGNDLNALAPEELVNMVVPELYDLFLLRYVRGELRIEKTAGVERAGQGPIIVVCDESESMSQELDAQGNTREMWSKAFSLAMSDQARRDNRDFIYIGFGNAQELWSTTFEKGRASLAKVQEFVTHFFNGGTHYERPLREAIEVVKRYERAGKPKPDILFITDGACRVPEAFVGEWQEMRSSADVRCYGVQIGGSPNSVMRSLVDRAISLSRLNTNPADMAELFRTV